MPPDNDRGEIMRELLNGAIPVNPQGSGFVTKEEFMVTVRMIESKIENAALKQKQWVLTGVVATLLAFGGGYVSLVQKLDRLNEMMPVMVQRQNERAPWIQRQEQRDAMQDSALQKLDRRYQALPYEAPPQ